MENIIIIFTYGFDKIFVQQEILQLQGMLQEINFNNISHLKLSFSKSIHRVFCVGSNSEV